MRFLLSTVTLLAGIGHRRMPRQGTRDGPQRVGADQQDDSPGQLHGATTIRKAM